MRRLAKLPLSAVVIAASSFGASPVLAGPFGLDAGFPLERLQVTEQYGLIGYKIKPPVPNPVFKQYLVRAAPTVGVCQVNGYNEHVESEDLLAHQFKDVRNILTEKYGEPTSDPSAKTTPYFGGIQSKEVVWSTTFDERLPDKLEHIKLEWVVTSNNKKIRIEYSFLNNGSCIDWAIAQDRAGL